MKCVPLLSAFITVSVILGSNAAETFVVAPQPPASGMSPVRGADEQKRFTLPPGFEIELVASEEEGVGKPITVAWDDAGRLWTMTALEYPLDGNEQPDVAKALYEKGGRDRILVFDQPNGPGLRQPRVFADGLAMPMGILPYKDGALVGQGPDVYWMHDKDGDGKADERETILTGFGIQDSHLMPHQFTRAPGGWFYLAQGAFNYSKVKTRDGSVHPFDQTRLARFTVDGLKFEDLTCGPCNIWGLVIGREGETFIQEANDYGYPVMAYHEGASYPGCSGAFKLYAPYFPSEVEFRMGGTGLSGLALSDPSGSFPGPYADVMYVANPITRKIQAIKIHRDGPWYRYELLGDFVLSSDEWFRPVAIHFGPDGCLYIVDWYNKIISHNEVPRTHPERDKTRGRIWRVRHDGQQRTVPDVAKATDRELLAFLQSDSTWQMRAAWHQIVDRKLVALVPELIALAENSTAQVPARIHALWCLEDLKSLQVRTIRAFLKETNRNYRREALRALKSLVYSPLSPDAVLALIGPFASDEDPEVRAEVIRVAALLCKTDQRAMALLGRMAKPALDGPVGKNPNNGRPMLLREAYDREFERYLIRSTLERIPEPTLAFLGSVAGKEMPIESRLLFTLALPKEESSPRTASLLPDLNRPPNEEELLRVVESIDAPSSMETIKSLLGKRDSRIPTLEALLKVRSRTDATKLGVVLRQPLLDLWGEGQKEFVARVAGAFKVEALGPVLSSALSENSTAGPVMIAVLRALRELEVGVPEQLAKLIRSSHEKAVRDEALYSLATARNAGNTTTLLEFWPEMNAVQHRSALRQFTRTKESAAELVSALGQGRVSEQDLDAETVDRLRELLPDNKNATELVDRLSLAFKPVLRLDGGAGSYVDSNIELNGPFTVETWVRLDPGIGNEDGILGFLGGADFNFANGTFRVYCGPEYGDRAIARRPMAPNAWTHLAVTRDAKGVFRLYINGEIDSTDPRGLNIPFTDLDIGRTTPNKGTAGSLTEFRVWNLARSAEEIRSDFDRTFAGELIPSGLVHYYPGGGPWGTLKGGAKIEKVTDAPPLLTGEQARAQAAKFARFRSLAEHDGSVDKGKTVFAATCSVCHSVGGQGGQIGPVLNGAGANGVETLLRALLTPNAAMEAGYRTFRVQLKDGDVQDGFLVSQTPETIVLRQPNREDQRISMNEVKRADFTRTSLMPEGLLDSMPEKDVRDLFAYLKTLK